jgi:hypothetical protein
LNDRDNQSQVNALKDNLGFLYNGVATLASQLDDFKIRLPAEVPLEGALQNLIRTQLSPAFKQLIAYYRSGRALGLVNSAFPLPVPSILGSPMLTFDSVLTGGLSPDWSEDQDWNTFTSGIQADASVYGSSADTFTQINHCATHNLFKGVFDQFLRVFARVVADAGRALDDTLSDWDSHEPHYALFLAFLSLHEYARRSMNTLTSRHLDFYFRRILGLKEKAAEPGEVHLLAELAKNVPSRDFEAGELYKAGKDALGRDAFFSNDADVVANQAKVAAQKTLYRHGDEAIAGADPTIDQGRIYASPMSNSDDGQGAALTSPDQSWHPFFNKIYVDGSLSEIRMPQAQLGFAIASHYLLLAEGERTIAVGFKLNTLGGGFNQSLAEDVRCLLTTEKGWYEATPSDFSPSSDELTLIIELDGAAPPITPYVAKTHGYNFTTDLPVLLVLLRHRSDAQYIYPGIENGIVSKIDLSVDVEGLKTLAVGNDFGPVDASKPFQPFGASPVAGSALVIGSKEVFQKNLTGVQVDWTYQVAPAAYTTAPQIGVEFLSKGQWEPAGASPAVTASEVVVDDLNKLALPVLDQPDLGANEPYGTSSRRGFLRLSLSADFGQSAFLSALLTFLKSGGAQPTPQPVAPTASGLILSYTAETTIELDSTDADAFASRVARFFHVAPFGTAEQHPCLVSDGQVRLLPQFSFDRNATTYDSEGELYLGISGLSPPQNLSLLFQVADGTANPLAPKPNPHIAWSYLKNNEWVGFAANEVQDASGELLDSGIVTLAVPREATDDNTLFPAGMHWIRAAVSENSDAVCRLLKVAAQALKASFADRGNAPDFSATPLPAGTISKLDQPDSLVKSLSQPFPSFGGRGAEEPGAFYTRVSERLRHKDRAIALWDYERLVLEAFPQIDKVKCLNHVCYEPNEDGTGTYRELAPGHVTVVTVPRLHLEAQRDPLKPYTSLGLLAEIQAFLEKRASCFARLHVRNPQFEEVRVSFKLRLLDGFDETYTSNQIRQAITRFLSPWAFTEDGRPSFGGKIYKSVLINFVEDQAGVDYVTDFQVFHDVGAGVGPGAGTQNPDAVEGSTAVSILVSAPASKHVISIIRPAPESAAAQTCSCPA